MSRVRAVLRVLKTGNKLVNSVKTKRQAIWTNSLVGFLGALAAATAAFGFDFGITLAQVKDAGEAVAGIVGGCLSLYAFYNAWQTAATSETVGVPIRAKLEPVGKAERPTKERKSAERPPPPQDTRGAFAPTDH